MVEIARAEGIPELWGGNFGIYSPSTAKLFDHNFVGWGENQILDALQLSSRPIKHPELYLRLYTRFNTLLQKWGFLFTSRGCNAACNFCQTPKFYKKPFTINYSQIEKVLKKYKENNVYQVIILDENFGYFLEHSEEIINRLNYYGLKWHPLTRIETLFRNYDHWIKKGLVGASFGVESLNQIALDRSCKGNDVTMTKDLLNQMKKDNLFIQAFYIIGFPEDTKESIKENIMELKKYRIDAPQIQILTPFPNTKNYDLIKKNYGFLTNDLNQYDATHLVWKHPKINPKEMRDILKWANQTLFTNFNSFLTLKKYFYIYLKYNFQRLNIRLTKDIPSQTIKTCNSFFFQN